MINAPFECKDEPPKELRRFIQQNSDDARFKSWLLFQSWLKQDEQATSTPDCVYGLERVTQFLSDFLAQQEPFDGILAFSQGGIIYRHFFSISQQIDPAAFQDQHGNTKFKIPKFLISVASPVFPRMRFSYKNIEYSQASEATFNFPSIHLNGIKDIYAQQLTCHQLFKPESNP